MNIIIIDKYGKAVLKTNVNFIPRKGDKFDWGSNPMPCVIDVVAYPTKDTLNTFEGLVNCSNIDAVVLLG